MNGFVTDLKSATQSYWNAKKSREEQAAYHEILLFGGPDGYRTAPRWAAAVIRGLRRTAYWIERKWL